MKYYLIVIQKVNDGTQPASMTAYDTEEQAMSAYYSTLASCYIAENLTFFSVSIVTESFDIRAHDDREKTISLL